jgi:NAD(P)-dependent dehydrogenase (short-subunit alcohol dehydrogenase family)
MSSDTLVKRYSRIFGERPLSPENKLTPGSVAVITGGASGIGLAAASRLAALGLKVCIADLGAQRLSAALEKIRQAAGGHAEAMAVETDVSQLSSVEHLEGEVSKRFGGTDVLMNNAGISLRSTCLDQIEHWQRLLAVNLWGVIHGTQVFVPKMLERGSPGYVINTGSKQGITTPPGNPAYNVSKAGVKAFTEALEHQLRNTPGAKISAHLLIPGYVFTGMTSGDKQEKPAGAWTPEQTVEFMLQRLAAGDFYILCPDNEVTRATDEKRIVWAAGDIVENRPPLSRWHPDYSGAFEAFCKRGGGP